MKENKKTSPNRRIIYLVISLLCSLALWVYVRTAVNPYADSWFIAYR